MPKPRKISEPEKELRFTRARQALTFVAVGVIFVCVAIAIWVKATPMIGNAAGEAPAISSPWWALVPLLPALWSFWVARHCAQHAFIILTPLGVELFPFFFPSKNMQAIYWSEIGGATVDDALRTLTLELDGGGKIFVALAPIATSARPLLKRAVEGRMADAAKDVQDPEN